MGYITIPNDDSCNLEDLGQIKLFFLLQNLKKMQALLISWQI